MAEKRKNTDHLVGRDKGTSKGASQRPRGVALRVVKIADLNVDPSYQRGITTKVKRISEKFDWAAFESPTVGEREDGSLWIVNGQQRIEAAKSHGIKELRCNVFASNGPEHEAEIFMLINKDRTSLRPVELFAAALTSGDEDAWKLKTIVEDEGFKIVKTGWSTSTQNPEWYMTHVTAINTFMKVLKAKNCGEPAVRFILRAISRGLPADPLRLKIEVVSGMWSFWARMNGEIDLERFVPRLQGTTAAKLIHSAQLGVGDRGTNVGDVLQRIYLKRTPPKSVTLPTAKKSKNDSAETAE